MGQGTVREKKKKTGGYSHGTCRKLLRGACEKEVGTKEANESKLKRNENI